MAWSLPSIRNVSIRACFYAIGNVTDYISSSRECTA